MIEIRKMDDETFVIHGLFGTASYFMTKTNLIDLKSRIEDTIALIEKEESNKNGTL